MTLRDEAKLDELVLYVSSRMQDTPNYGAVLLNKVLFFAEVLFFVEHGRSITGADYMRLEQGPVLRRMLPVQRRLVDNDAAEVQEVPYGRFTQKRLVPLRQADVSHFEQDELAMVDKMVELFGGLTARQASEMSHSLLGWRLARDREVIPLETVFLYDGPITDEDRSMAKVLAARHA